MSEKNNKYQVFTFKKIDIFVFTKKQWQRISHK